MQLPAGGDKKSLHIGCFAEKSHRIIDIDACPIQKGGNNEIIPVVRQWMKEYKIPAYDEDKGTGIVRHIMGRTGVHSGEIMVCPHGCPYERTCTNAAQRRAGTDERHSEH